MAAVALVQLIQVPDEVGERKKRTKPLSTHNVEEPANKQILEPAQDARLGGQIRDTMLSVAVNNG